MMNITSNPKESVYSSFRFGNRSATRRFAGHSLYVKPVRPLLALVCLLAYGLLQSGCKPAKDEAIQTLADPSVFEVSVPEDWLVCVDQTYLDEALYQSMGFYFNPLSRLRSDVPEERLNAMVESELIWQDALRKKVEQAPLLRRQIQQLVIQHYLDTQILAGHSPKNVTPEEVRAYYDQNMAAYHRPAAVRVAHILVDANRLDAHSVARELLQKPGISQPGGFGRLARQYSDDTGSRVRGGDLGFVELHDAEDWQHILAGAADKLPTVGSVSAELIQTEKGLHVVKLIGRRSAQTESFNQVRRRILRRLESQELAKVYRNYIDALKATAEIEYNQERFQGIMQGTNASDRLISNEQSRAKEELASKAVTKPQVLSVGESIQIQPLPDQPLSAVAGDKANFVTTVSREVKIERFPEVPDETPKPGEVSE